MTASTRSIAGRTHGRPVEGLSAHHFSASFRIMIRWAIARPATGWSRSSAWIERRLRRALVLTAPFIPMLFQGEEFAASTPFQYFADHEDPEMAKAVSEGRRREFAAFGWPSEAIPDPEKRETFERSKLNWDEVHEGHHAEMLEWYTQLIHLRRRSPSLNDGDMGHVEVRFR